MYDVITVGSATVDVFAKTEAELISITKHGAEEELIAYPTGSKILIEKLDFKIGGGGTNTAVAFARLGLKTAYLGKLGNDENADKIVGYLKKEKIDFIGKKGNEQAGYSIILDSMAEDRTILTNKGANNSLRYNELNPKKMKTKWFYFSSMMGESLVTLKKITNDAAKNGIKVAFNPSSYLVKEDRNAVLEILKKTSILIYNKEEAELLSGVGDYNSLLIKSLEAGPEIVAITNGKEGCITCQKVNGKFVTHTIRPRKVKVVETTGAGDAFASSFLSGYIKSKGDIKFSLSMGMANAESVIQNVGAKEILLTHAQVMRSIKKNPYKIVKGSI